MTDLHTPVEGRAIPNSPDLYDQPPTDPQPDVEVETPPARTNGHAKPRAGRPARTTPTSTNGTPPAHDTNAEAALLGAALINTDAAELVTQLGATPFYNPLHQHIAHAISTLHADQLPVDPVTVIGRLTDLGHTDHAAQAVTLAQINQIASDAPAGHAQAHAERVDQLHRARQIEQRAHEAASIARRGDPDGAWRLLQPLLDTPPPALASSIPTLNEFLDVDEDDHVWTIPNLLETTDRLLLTGPEGGGKSTLLRQIAVQTAAGIHPFTQQDMPPLRVLLLDLENSARHIRREIRALHIKADHQAGDRLHIASLPAGLDLLDPHDARTLEALIATTGAQLIIGGPVYKLVGGDPTEEQPAKAAVTLMDRLRERYDCAWILETHQPHESSGKRPERPYGASIWKRWPEFGLHLAQDGQLRHWRGDRDQRDWPPTLTRGGDWPWTVAAHPDATFARAAQLCRNAGRTLSYRDLGTQLGASKSQIERMLKANQAAWDALRTELEGDF